MCFLMTHGEGGKKETLSKHKMSIWILNVSFKANSGAFLAKIMNWFEWLNFILMVY
jgi:hypothetical protein